MTEARMLYIYLYIYIYIYLYIYIYIYIYIFQIKAYRAYYALRQSCLRMIIYAMKWSEAV